MNRVVRVYGECDDWQVEFTNKAGNEWQCSVPADLTDGQYACQFYAVDEDGDIGYWCGVLYMSSGKVCFSLDDDPIGFTFVHETLSFTVDTADGLEFDVMPEPLGFTIEGESLTFSFIRECCDGLRMQRNISA